MMKKFLILSLLVKMIFTTYTSEEEEFLESINFDPTFEQLAISACWLMIIYENADNTEVLIIFYLFRTLIDSSTI